jgi:hypothetical protein
MEDLLVCLGLMAFTFMLNIPLGMWRASVRKFSLAWMIAVHASVPVIVALRLWLDVSYILIPALIATAILSQWVGARFYQHRSELNRIGKVGED